MNRLQNWMIGLVGIFCFGCFILCWNLRTTVTMLSQECNAVYGCLFTPETHKAVSDSLLFVDATKKSLFCQALQGVPYLEDLGILKSVKDLNLEGAYAPHNASIVEDKDGYLMVFRHDQKEKKEIFGFSTGIKKKIPFYGRKMPYRTFISAVKLDHNFKQISPVQRIDLHSDFVEDPRVFRAGEKLYLTYNDMQETELYSRTMFLASLHPDTLETLFISDIDQHIQHVDQTNHVEKNWVPFARLEEGEEQVYFEYSINPHKVMRLKDPKKSEMDHLIAPHYIAFQKTPWAVEKWGNFRGGTPARLINGQYFAFFHTLFYENRTPWYVMGAYTFEASPPYRVTAVSPYPILFKGIYGTKTKNTAHSRKKAIYPAGLAQGQEEGRDVIYLSVGENDCTVKLLTFDQEALLNSLVSVPLRENPKEQKQ